MQYLRIDGSINKPGDRQAIIDSFNTDMRYTVLLLTTQVGGVGLNLTSADRVIICKLFSFLSSFCKFVCCVIFFSSILSKFKGKLSLKLWETQAMGTMFDCHSAPNGKANIYCLLLLLTLINFADEPSWNPATDAQAVDRSYRIGQTKPVIVYRLLTSGTIEEKIYRKQVFKNSITRQATGESFDPIRYSTMLFTTDLSPKMLFLRVGNRL